MAELDDNDIVIAIERYLISESLLTSMFWVDYETVDKELKLPPGSTRRLLGQAVELRHGWKLLAGANTAKIFR